MEPDQAATPLQEPEPGEPEGVDVTEVDVSVFVVVLAAVVLVVPIVLVVSVVLDLKVVILEVVVVFPVLVGVVLVVGELPPLWRIASLIDLSKRSFAILKYQRTILF